MGEDNGPPVRCGKALAHLRCLPVLLGWLRNLPSRRDGYCIAQRMTHRTGGPLSSDRDTTCDNSSLWLSWRTERCAFVLS